MLNTECMLSLMILQWTKEWNKLTATSVEAMLQC